MESHQELTRYVERLQRHVAELRDSTDSGETPASSDSATVTGLSMLAREVNELRAAFEELQAADDELREQHERLIELREHLNCERERYRSLFDDAPDAYLVTDLGGNILEANRAAADMLGVSQPRLCGKPILLFVAKKDRQRFWVHLNAAIGSHQPSDFELLIQSRQRPEMEALVRVAPVLSRAGRPASLRWLIHDITRRKRAERMLQASLIQLRQSERLASIGTLAAGIAHEIRNPLSSIVMAAQCAAQSTDPAKTSQMLSAIQEATQRITRVVQGVLQFARNEETPKEPTDLNEVILQTTDIIRNCLPAHRVTLDLRLCPELPQLPLNQAEFEQALLGLVKNASEATTGPVHVIVRTLLEDAGVRIVVEDNGPGIPPEHLQHIFDPFFTTHQAGGRIGLGLSIVHNIISDHGGSVSVQSSPGEGSCFTIRLPTPGRG